MPPEEDTIDLIGRIARTATDVATAVREVGSLLDGDRSCVLTVENKTDYTLRLGRYHHSSGGFAATPPMEIPPHSTAVFGSQDTGVMRGAIGWVNYRVLNDRIPLTWMHLAWSNPFAGRNSSQALAREDSGYRLPSGIIPVRSTRFRASSITGSGEVGAQMRYTVEPI